MTGLPAAEMRKSGSEPLWFLYIIRCRDDSLYTGITTDVRRRFRDHNSGAKGARYLRGRGPLRIVFKKKAGTKSDALRLEYMVKKLSKKGKEEIVRRKKTVAAIFNTSSAATA